MIAFASSGIAGAGYQLSQSHRPAANRSVPARLQATYDAAKTFPLNERHWLAADHFNADQANSPEVRAIVRQRARYEALESSGLLNGIIQTYCHYLISTGPQLQVQSRNDELNETIERHWAAWSHRIDLASRMMLLRQTQLVDGEAFVIRVNNDRLPSGHVQLDFVQIPCELCTSLEPLTDTHVDGIDLDRNGLPTGYTFRKNHERTETRPKLPAAEVIHLFRAMRPGQHRGISELVTALPMAATIRAYVQACLENARIGASITGVIKTTRDDVPDSGVAAGDAISLSAGELLAMAYGQELQAYTPAQPMATMPEFLRCTIALMMRGLCVPYGVGMMDFSSHSYASGQMDDQGFIRAIEVERARLGRHLLDELLSWFLAEIVALELISRAALTEAMGDTLLLPHRWGWPGFDHADPAKVARAQETKLANHTTTLAHEYAKRGLDWEAQLRQRARELALLNELNIPLANSSPNSSPAPGQPDLEEALP